MTKAPRRTPSWDFDCAVIGGGPAGLATALALARFRRSVVLFNSGKPRVTWAPRIHNLMGFPRGIAGAELLRKFQHQVRSYPEIKILNAQASVRRYTRGFSIHIGRTGGRTTYFARKVVLATGVQDRQPALPNLDRMRKTGLLRYCSICDGYEMAGKTSAVLVRDDEGLQKALYLHRWSKEMKILAPADLEISKTRKRQLRGVGAEVIRCVEFGLSKPEAGKKMRLTIGDGSELKAGIVYVELGAEVKSDAFAGLHRLRRVEGNFLETSPQQRTSIPGLFAVGDCVNGLGQVAVALGQASVAAAQIHDELTTFR